MIMQLKKLLVAVSLILVFQIQAKKAPNHQTQLLQEVTSHSLSVDNKTIDSQTLLPTMMFNINYKVTLNAKAYSDKNKLYEAMARQFLAENQTIFKTNKTDYSELKLAHVSKGKASTTVRFKQYINAIPVYKSNVAISINHKNTVTYLSAAYKLVDKLVPNKSSLSPFLAEDIAINFLGFNTDLKLLKSKKVVYAENNQTLLAYKILVASNQHPGEWEIILNAQNGEVIKAVDTLLYAQVPGSVSLFNPDPLTTAGVNYGTSGYTDDFDLDSPELSAQVKTLNNVNIEQVDNSVFKLESPWAVIVDIGVPNDGLFTQDNANFSFTRGDDAFEASNVFAHIDFYMNYLNTTLGVDVMPREEQYLGGVQFDPHGFDGQDNSFFSSNTGHLEFGEGGVDDAEDADVIIHELGHGLHDWVTNGNLSQVNGLSEGTGDYFANSYARTRPDNQWTSDDDEYYWVFSWDGHNEYWGGRQTNYTAIYPGGLIGQIHTDGQIWASCLMKIWDELGHEKTDTMVLEGLRMTGNNTNQAQAAQAVLQAAVELGHNSNELFIIEQQFNNCGYAVTTDIIFKDGFD